MRPMRSCEHSPKPSAYQERPNEYLGRRALFAVLSDQSVVLSAARTKLSQKQEPNTVVDGGLFRASGHRQPPGCSRPHRAADGRSFPAAPGSNLSRHIDIARRLHLGIRLGASHESIHLWHEHHGLPGRRIVLLAVLAEIHRCAVRLLRRGIPALCARPVLPFTGSGCSGLPRLGVFLPACGLRAPDFRCAAKKSEMMQACLTQEWRIGFVAPENAIVAADDVPATFVSGSRV